MTDPDGRRWPQRAEAPPAAPSHAELTGPGLPARGSRRDRLVLLYQRLVIGLMTLDSVRACYLNRGYRGDHRCEGRRDECAELARR